MYKYFAEHSQMKTSRIPFLALILSIATVSLLSCNQNKYVTIQGYAQGGTYTVKANLYGENGRIRKSPEQLKSDIDSILNTIDTTLSGYNKGSILSRLNAGKRVHISRYGIFDDIYTRSYDYFQETAGALDVASGPLFDLWGFGFTRDSLPSDEKVKECLTECGMKRLRRNISSVTAADGTVSASDLLTDSVKTAFPDAPAPKLNFNAIAQGFSCDLVADYLYTLGVKDMLVDIGEIYCDGLNPNGKPWKVGVDRPLDGNNNPGQDLDGIWTSSGTGCGIVTSGNYRKYYIKDGKKYAHTIDPRTGYPVDHSLLSATIVADNATDADAYATYCMVLGLEKAREFIESRPDELAGYLIYNDENGEIREWASDNFNLSK